MKDDARLVIDHPMATMFCMECHHAPAKREGCQRCGGTGHHPIPVQVRPDILARMDEYEAFDAETCFVIFRKADGANVARADWVRDGEALWNVWQDARAEIARLRARLAP